MFPVADIVRHDNKNIGALLLRARTTAGQSRNKRDQHRPCKVPSHAKLRSSVWAQHNLAICGGAPVLAMARVSR